jgi:membrane protease YdiL (CAAX protease family)
VSLDGDIGDPLPPAVVEPTAEAAAPPGKPLGHPVVRIVAFCVATAGVQFVAGVGVMLGVTALDWAPRTELALVVYALAAPLIVLVTALFARFADRRPLAEIGARWPARGPRSAAPAALGTALATLGLVALWVALIEALPAADLAVVGWSDELGDWPALVLGALLVGFLIQGGLEEWVARGYVYRTLKERSRPLTAAVASSLLFSVFHAFNPSYTWVSFVNIALAGLILAALVERSGSLWSATIAHGVWNFSVACLLSVPVSGIDLLSLLDVSVTGHGWLTGGGFGPEGSLVLTALGLPLAVWLWRSALPREAAVSPVSPEGDDLGATAPGGPTA